jgi:hypothetical protein
LSRQLASDEKCSGAALAKVFTKFPNGDANGYPITTASFLSYISRGPRFYNGTKSTMPYGLALYGEGSLSFNLKNRKGNPGNWQVTIKDIVNGSSQTTAITVTPSYPLKTFWQPTFTPPDTGIDPSDNGVNFNNESDFFHETLHGMTGLYDKDIQRTLGIKVSDDTSNISSYIQLNVLSQCPTFKRGGK